MKTSSAISLLALTFAVSIHLHAQSRQVKTYTPDFGKAPVKTVTLLSPKESGGQIGSDPTLPADIPASQRIILSSVKASGKLSPENELILYSDPGKNFKVEMTVKFNMPVPTKLAANLLMDKAKILDADAVKEMRDHHSLTWHFDTESRLGYGSVEGEGEITFDLIGKAPKEKGSYTFDLNLGLFDKINWGTKVMKTHKVTLITDTKIYDETAPATTTPTDEPLPWTAADGRVIQARFIRLEGEAVVIEKDGKQFSVPFSNLAPPSAEQAKRLGGLLPPIGRSNASASNVTKPVPAPAAEKAGLNWVNFRGDGIDSPPIICGTDGGDVIAAFKVHERVAGYPFRGIEVARHAAADGAELWRVAVPASRHYMITNAGPGRVLLTGEFPTADPQMKCSAVILSETDGHEVWRWESKKTLLQQSIAVTPTGEVMVADEVNISLMDQKLAKPLWTTDPKRSKPGFRAIYDAVMDGQGSILGHGYFRDSSIKKNRSCLFKVSLADGKIAWVKDCPEEIQISLEAFQFLRTPQHSILASPQGHIYMPTKDEKHQENGFMKFTPDGDAVDGGIRFETLQADGLVVKRMVALEWISKGDFWAAIVQKPTDGENVNRAVGLMKVTADGQASILQQAKYMGPRMAKHTTQSGRVFWMDSTSHGGYDGWIKSISLTDVETGKPVWKRENPFGKSESGKDFSLAEMSAVGDGLVICTKASEEESGTITAPTFHLISGKDGSILWSKSWGPPMGKGLGKQ